jgi:putative flippase GtrA
MPNDSPYKRSRMILGTVLGLIVVYILPHFFSYIEKRNGTLLNDWLLDRIPPHNVSVLIFAIIWGMVILILIRAIYNPSIYITYCWGFVLVCIARFITIILVPLDPPTGLIPLTDPLTGVFYGNALIIKDLFFSGHTATLTLVFLCLRKRNDKIIAFCAVVAVAVLLLVQHIHYTIDILAAPFITYACYRLARYLLYRAK